MASTNDNNEPFAFGDGTLMQLREQPWDFDELGTMMVKPEPAGDATVMFAPPTAPVATAPPATPALPVEVFADAQAAAFGEETKMILPTAAPVLHAAEPAPAADPLARIEQRLEELTRAVVSMQRRLDSIDQAMARFLAR